MGIPDSSTPAEQITATVTTTYNDAPPPYSAHATSSSSSTVEATVPESLPSYDQHVEMTKKKQVVTVTHVPSPQALPPGTVRVVHLQSFGADAAIVRYV